MEGNSATSRSSFVVSAPGKVIVFGEHAAVFGKPAIAAAVSLRSYLLVTASSTQRSVRMNFRDIDLDHTWDVNALPWGKFHQFSKKQRPDSRMTSLDPELLDSVKPHAEAVSTKLPEKRRKVHIRSATAFLYLYLSLGSPSFSGLVYTLRSTIPIGAGLGSSASVCVCLSAALLLQAGDIDTPHLHQPSAEGALAVECINKWAFVGELCIHGSPSGVDNTVSAGGKAVLFQRAQPEPRVARIEQFPRLRLLLVDTNAERSTFTQVEKVKKLHADVPLLSELILDGIGQTTVAALELFSTADFSLDGLSDSTQRLGTLMRINHGLLVSLGVSHPRLERIRELVDHTNIGWTKLTGAGGGGCAITLLKPGVQDEPIRLLEETFVAEGFKKYETFLGTEGVGVLWPVVFGDSMDKVGAHGDQGVFEDAIDVEGIERLVGVNEQGKREKWKFWQ